MPDTKTLENITFTRTINTIIPANFPTKFSLHWHKYIEILALPEDSAPSDSVTITIQNTTYILHPGDILFVWPGELHEIIDNPSQKMIGVQFSPTVFQELPDFAPYLQLFRNIHYISVENNTELAQNINGFLSHMISLQSTPGNFRGVETLICLYECFMDLGNHLTTLLPEQQLSSSQKNAQWEKIHHICNYITENCDQDLTLDSVAGKAGFNPYYFSRLFRKITGYTFVEYLSMQRVKRAQMLLANIGLSMTEIAYQSGFKSISTFNRAFLTQKGCSPSQYRKYYLSDF